MQIMIGSDHAGYEMKNEVAEFLRKRGYSIQDVGTFSEESVDYPDFAFKVAEGVAKKEADYGVLICGSGIGVSISANKVKGIRCALVYNLEVARLAKEHNDANILAFGSRFMTASFIEEAIQIFLGATFEEGRHCNRIRKIKAYERGENDER
jgi:ribose 5-phosphate isomerase B